MEQIEKIIILDFGSQTTQLIARRLRELHEYCEIVPYNKFPTNDENVVGVVLSGSPLSVNDHDGFKPDLAAIRGRYPVLGICYGAQYMAHLDGGTIEKGDRREYGRAKLTFVAAHDPLIQGIQPNSQVWMSHGDTITTLPPKFEIIASTTDVAVAAYKIATEPTWAVQFHPEVYHTEIGAQILDIF
jgi:GMP synthase (glutamine-hydrolysing)